MSAETDRAVEIVEVKKDIEAIKGAVERIEATPHRCEKEPELSGLQTWRKILSAGLALALTFLLGMVSFGMTTCERQSSAASALTTRVDNHSRQLDELRAQMRESDKQRNNDMQEIRESLRQIAGQ